MSNTAPKAEERKETLLSNGSKWKWILGVVLAIVLPLLGFTAGYGGLEASTIAATQDINSINITLEKHDTRLDKQDVNVATQTVILIRVEKTLEKLVNEVQKHLQEHHDE